jgi:hypothetical protein
VESQIKTLIYRLYFNGVQNKVQNKLLQNIPTKLIICDIDNTILKRLHEGKKSYSTDFLVYEKVVEFVKYQLQNVECTLLFISARGIKHYCSTNNLIFSLFPNIQFNLILTRNAFDKIYYLDYFSKCAEIIYIDDLSFQNFSSKICFYEDVIKKVREIKTLQYIGYEELIKMQV